MGIKSAVISVSYTHLDVYKRQVYIDGNPFTGTYLRNGEGDYRCTKEEVQAMLRHFFLEKSINSIIPDFILFC